MEFDSKVGYEKENKKLVFRPHASAAPRDVIIDKYKVFQNAVNFLFVRWLIYKHF